MNWNIFIIRLAGKIIILIGIIIAIFDFSYDKMVGREGPAAYFGPIQFMVLTFCLIAIFVGYLLNILRKSENEWTWEIGDGSFGEWLWHLIAIFIIPLYWLIKLFIRHKKEKTGYKKWD